MRTGRAARGRTYADSDRRVEHEAAAAGRVGDDRHRKGASDTLAAPKAIRAARREERARTRGEKGLHRGERPLNAVA
ncbi:hypothetical protein ACFY2H_06110 [Streptomyces griseofuscus]|uniref:hypothetical protein n=1 Tax=Streptomyces TaxID=1883 RepID=UPI0016044E2A|nr:hypothetical protein [Streptomyces murinus]MBA9050220.1 hypothetical protein [Streptomyces murinus]